MERKNRQGNYFLESIADFQNVEKEKMIQSKCLYIIFVNDGDDIVFINGTKLLVNRRLEIRQQPGFIDRTQYQIVFNGVGTNPDLSIFRILPKNQSKIDVDE